LNCLIKRLVHIQGILMVLGIAVINSAHSYRFLFNSGDGKRCIFIMYLIWINFFGPFYNKI
jgi:hypothetical protein